MLSVEQLLQLRNADIIKMGDPCERVCSLKGDNEIDCPYRESNCQGKICPKFMAYVDVNDPIVVKQEIKEMGFDIDKMETFELLMSMQKLFAAKFHNVEGLTKTEQDHWINAYLVCIEDEVREVREHLNIYPDVESKTNKVEMKKEIIDILHFMMDEFICGAATFQDIKNAYLKEYATGVVDVEDLFKYAVAQQDEKVKQMFIGYQYDEACLLMVNRLLDCSAEVRQCISWKHWKKPSETIDYDKLYKAFAHTFKVFVDLCVYNEMYEKDIKEIYIKKNLENRRRQVWGY